MKTIKSFGLIEAMIASFIAILVLTAAVSLSRSVSNSTVNESSFAQAGKIANNLLENINSANATGRVFFDSRGLTDLANNLVSIECFDSLNFGTCATQMGWQNNWPSYVDFYANTSRTTYDETDPGYYKITGESDSAGFTAGFFKIKTSVVPLQESGASFCRSSEGISIPATKCRVVDVEIKWSEISGDRTYKVSRYLTDWTR